MEEGVFRVCVNGGSHMVRDAREFVTLQMAHAHFKYFAYKVFDSSD